MRLIFAYIPLALWAAGVLVVGGLDLGAVSLPSGTDKAAHFLAYGLGGALAALAGRWSGRGRGWAGLVFVALVAATDELRQAGLAHRHGDPMDWLADMAGALAFFVVARGFLRKRAGGE
ncbi:MAG TPA: VanZ family protein [Longimicrobiales bacterium]|nr:VanZ family protein [Longimicrobiales bacterium]